MRKAFDVLIFAVISFIAAGYVLDILALVNASEGTLRNYFISEHSQLWHLQSASNFIIKRILSFAFLCSILFGVVWSHVRRTKISLWFYHVTLGIFLILVIRYLLMWYLSGFDHYPGFNPYLF